MPFFQTSGGSGRSGNEYDNTLATNCRHFLYNLSKEGATEIRVVPALVNGAPEPLLNTEYGSTLQEALTSAFAVVDVVRFLGPNKASMICPPPVEGERKGPVHYFIDTILDSAENDPKGCPDDWLRWCGKGRDRPKAVIQRPQQIVMMQGFLYSHKGRPCVDKENRPIVRSPVVLMLNRSATNDLLEKLSKPADANGAWGSDNNKLGDPVDLTHGRIMKFSPYPKEFNNQMQTWYMAELADEVPLTIEDAASVWQPWEQVLNYNPTLAEIGMWLTKAFNAETVVRVFENHPVYNQCITESIRRMVGASSAPVQGYSMPAYNPPESLRTTQDIQSGYTPTARPAVSRPEPYPPVPEAYNAAAPATDDQLDDDALPFDQHARRDVSITPRTIERRAPRQ